MVLSLEHASRVSSRRRYVADANAGSCIDGRDSGHSHGCFALRRYATSSFGTPSHQAFARSLEDLGDSAVLPAGRALSPPPGSEVSAALIDQEPNRKARLRPMGAAYIWLHKL